MKESFMDTNVGGEHNDKDSPCSTFALLVKSISTTVNTSKHFYHSIHMYEDSVRLSRYFLSLSKQ